jgi:hypothetical protein
MTVVGQTEKSASAPIISACWGIADIVSEAKHVADAPFSASCTAA